MTPALQWHEPETYRCSECDATAEGSISGGGFFGEPTGPNPPPEWRCAYDAGAKKILYACSARCAEKIDLARR